MPNLAATFNGLIIQDTATGTSPWMEGLKVKFLKEHFPLMILILKLIDLTEK